LERDYLQLQVGFIACDSCLPAISNDFPTAGDSRLVALRLRHTRGINLEKLDNAIESARGKIERSGVHKLAEERQAIFWLHSQGEFVASMHAGQALFNSVSHLMDHLTGHALKKERMRTIALLKRTNVTAQQVAEFFLARAGTKIDAIAADAARDFGVSVATIHRRRKEARAKKLLS
jgi:hypothetical protein